MNFAERIQKFSNPSFIPEGWYWVFRSSDLGKNKAKSFSFLSLELVIYRGASGKVYATDAYCPHMGAHLCDGTVSGESIKCPFHYWKFSNEGECIDIPVGGFEPSRVEKLTTYKLEERYGLIWIWTGSNQSYCDLPTIPELAGVPVSSSLGSQFIKGCHPNVVMVNAIDAHHFTSVHNFTVDLDFKTQKISEKCIQFSNRTKVPPKNILFRWISKFYKEALTYEMTYWWGHTGSVMVGPDFLHFYIIFALRPNKDGQTEGQTILVTKKRNSILGKMAEKVILFLTKCVGNYFAKGDTIIFSRIKFNFKTPIAADKTITTFIHHYERLNESSIFKKLNKSSNIKSPIKTYDVEKTL